MPKKIIIAGNQSIGVAHSISTDTGDSLKHSALLRGMCTVDTMMRTMKVATVAGAALSVVAEIIRSALLSLRVEERGAGVTLLIEMTLVKVAVLPLTVIRSRIRLKLIVALMGRALVKRI